MPVDGVILSGRSSVDNAVLTGEAAPVPVHEGDGDQRRRHESRGEARRSRRRGGREDAHRRACLPSCRRRSRGSRRCSQTTDRLARRFVQVLLVLAAVTGAAWWHQGPAVALERVVALLVVACPCALGLSIPLALSVALMRAARAGIFVKNPDALERLRRVDTVLLDKTGTLTEGRATVTRWVGDDAALQFARALEAESAHAVARAFQRKSSRDEVPTTFPLRLVRTVEQVVEVPGQGIAGRLDGHDVRVGNRAHAEAAGAAVPSDAEPGGRGDDRRRSQPGVRRGGRRNARRRRNRRPAARGCRGDRGRDSGARRPGQDPLRRSPRDRRAGGRGTGSAARGRTGRPHPGEQARHRCQAGRTPGGCGCRRDGGRRRERRGRARAGRRRDCRPRRRRRVDCRRRHRAHARGRRAAGRHPGRRPPPARRDPAQHRFLPGLQCRRLRARAGGPGGAAAGGRADADARR